MVKKLFQKVKTDLQVMQEKKKDTFIDSTIGTADKGSFPLRVMEQYPNLSLGPSLSSHSDSSNGSAYKPEENYARKRKLTVWEESGTQTGIDFHHNDPLPLDWEQCLDLQSGRIYYQNRKTLMKSWLRPMEGNLDLDLNISVLPNSESSKKRSFANMEKTNAESSINGGGGGGSSSMVAVVCFNCHQLVMLYCSSPSCPNCKFIHSIPTPTSSPPQKVVAVKSFETLTLLH